MASYIYMIFIYWDIIYILCNKINAVFYIVCITYIIHIHTSHVISEPCKEFSIDN